ncbi:two component system response regulator [soil metagenome]
MVVVPVRRVLIVDDEKLLSELLAAAVTAAGFEVRVAASVMQARGVIRDFDPDVALLDIDLGAGPSGLHLGHLLARTRPDLALVFLTRFDGPDGADESGLDLPPNAALLRKQLVADPRIVVDALEAVLRNRAVAPPLDRADHDGPRARLRGKRLDVLRGVARGDSNLAIATHLGISTASVERYLVEIYKALGITNSAESNARVMASLMFTEVVTSGELDG